MLLLPLGWELIKVQLDMSFITQCPSLWRGTIRSVVGQDVMVDLLSVFSFIYMVIQAG